MATKIQKTALITGASSGIGLAYALELAKKNFRLSLLSLDKTRLLDKQHLFDKKHTQFLSKDLWNPNAVLEISEEVPAPDLIVANAGVTLHGRAGSFNVDKKANLYYLLCGGVIDLIESYLPEMRERRSGRIVIISSIGALNPMPKSSIYSSAKAGIFAYGRSIHQELKKDNIDVTVSLPGYVRTAAHKRAGLDHLERQIPSWMWITAQQAVRETEKASLAKKASIIPGRVYRFARPFLGLNIATRLWGALNRRQNIN